ncbi:MAG: creatininase family protein [Pseudothermotoga sp.]|nr:creatininase family protein [Pseudothermotoga sp.]
MEETCQILEKEHEVVKLFEIPLGSDTQPVFGSIWLSYGGFKRLVLEVGTHLSRMNFKYWIIFDNHGGPRHQFALAEASKKLKEKHDFNLIVPFLHIFQDMLNDSEAIKIPAGMNGDVKNLHAGTNETSLMLCVDPQLVRTKDLPRYFPKRETTLTSLSQFQPHSHLITLSARNRLCSQFTFRSVLLLYTTIIRKTAIYLTKKLPFIPPLKEYTLTAGCRKRVKNGEILKNSQRYSVLFTPNQKKWNIF